MILTPEEAISHTRILRSRHPTCKLVWTNGYFDLLHPGHLRGLEEAKRQGTILCVGVNKAELKRDRPLLNSLESRMEILNSLRCVDWVTWFLQPTPTEIITLLRPDVCCKGDEYRSLSCPEQAIVESWNGRMHFLEQWTQFSTSGLIERARSL